MIDSIDDITELFGDRVLVEVLNKPEKTGSFYVPESYAQVGRDHKSIFWGRVVKFGLDSTAEGKTNPEDEPLLRVGDIVGIEPMARDCTSLKTPDGKEYLWVPDEFIAVKDGGTMEAIYAGR